MTPSARTAQKAFGRAPLAASVTHVRGPDRFAARALARRLGDSVAFHARRPVAVVACLGQGGPTANPGLPSLARLARDPTAIVEHARCAARAGADTVMVDGVASDELTRRAANEVLDQLADHYAHVIAALPAVPPAAGLPPGALAALEQGGRTLYLVDDSGASRTQRGVAVLARRTGGEALPVAGLAHGAPAQEDVDRVAREIAGLSVGIALGAGGWRGFAHVGVLSALRRHGVPVDFVAGSSVGAVVGALWALAHTPDEIMRGLAETRRFLLRPALPWRSLLGNSGVRAHIERSAAGRSFEDALIPLAIVATDLHDGTEVVIRKGPLWPAVLASSSIPVLYPAVEFGERWLVDGGLVAPVPVTAVRDLGAKVAIGVRIDPAVPGRREGHPGARRAPPSLPVAISLALALVQARLGSASSAGADVVISPQLERTGWRDAERCHELGELAVAAALHALGERLPWLNGAARNV